MCYGTVGTGTEKVHLSFLRYFLVPRPRVSAGRPGPNLARKPVFRPVNGPQTGPNGPKRRPGGSHESQRAGFGAPSAPGRIANPTTTKGLTRPVSGDFGRFWGLPGPHRPRLAGPGPSRAIKRPPTDAGGEMGAQTSRVRQPYMG